jgi:hypothetical protein
MDDKRKRHVQCVEETRNEYVILAGKMKGRDHAEEPTCA